MIPQSIETWQTFSWQEELRAAITDPRELYEALQLDTGGLENAQKAHEDFAVRVPRPYLRRIEPGNPDDPLLRQVLPLPEELAATPGYSTDPLEESDSNPLAGLIHKYNGRVLLVVAPTCAINCRYCFRRHFPYEENNPGRNRWSRVLDYIAENPGIGEVIYSGGDPLMASDRQLQWLTESLADIPHLRRLRVHTRLPVVIPARITDECLRWLTGTRLQPVLVTHINHGNEIDGELISALARLKEAGVTLFNQSVLLKGVNDRPDTLVTLSEKLFAAGVLPYYLHLLDPVRGAAHYDIPEAEALDIHRRIQGQLPGFLVPRLVREKPGSDSKTVIA